MTFNFSFTNEMLEKAAKCETAEELIALAKSAGIEISKAEAEAYMAELENFELNEDMLEHVAGGEGCGCRLADCPCDGKLFW